MEQEINLRDLEAKIKEREEQARERKITENFSRLVGILGNGKGIMTKMAIT